MKRSIIITLLLCMGLPALAEPSFYGGIGAGKSSAIGQNLKHAKTANLTFGYKLNPYLATEFTYTQYGSFRKFNSQTSSSGNTTTTFTKRSKAKADTYGIGLVGFYPVCSNVDLFAKIGALYGSTDAKTVISFNQTILVDVIIDDATTGDSDADAGTDDNGTGAGTGTDSGAGTGTDTNDTGTNGGTGDQGSNSGSNGDDGNDGAGGGAGDPDQDDPDPGNAGNNNANTDNNGVNGNGSGNAGNGPNPQAGNSQNQNKGKAKGLDKEKSNNGKAKVKAKSDCGAGVNCSKKILAVNGRSVNRDHDEFWTVGYSAGVLYKISKRVNVTLSYDRVQNDIEAVNVGFQYKF